MPGNPYDGHTLDEALEQATILADASIHTAIVDRAYRSVEVDGVPILRSGPRLVITSSIKTMIKRRSAIEPALGNLDAIGSRASSATHYTRAV